MDEPFILVEIHVWDYWTDRDRFYMILEFIGVPEYEKYSNLVVLEGVLY